MTLPQIDTEYLLHFLSDLLNTPSPSGFTHQAITYTDEALRAFPGLILNHTRKGALVATLPGLSANSPRALTAHVDTLGAMVKEIKPNGRLKLTRVGNLNWNTVETEACTVYTRHESSVRGSFLVEKASTHVHSADVFNEIKRSADNMEVRLDARTTTAVQTRALGIEVGDFVVFDPRVEMVNGFVRSRHLDDKACVACLVAAVKSLHDAGLQPTQTAYLHISNFEETGHGAAAGIPPDITELVVVDMAAVGEGQNSDEFHASLCVKDSGGPYDHGLSQRLRNLADQHGIAYKVDTYSYYHSDGSVYWRTGADVPIALIGPGIDASHNYERTHLEALLATTQWVMAYLVSDT
jgi:putative aminopeptidase FrvX